MITNKKDAQTIANVWNNLTARSTEETREVAEVVEEKFVEPILIDAKWCKCHYVVIISPAEEHSGTAFYHVTELADVSGAFRTSSYIYIRNGKCYARIF